MIMINDVLVADEIVQEHFLCNLNACRGACCWEGDYGAPLEAAELDTLDRIYETIKPFLTPAGQAVIEKEGKYTYYRDANEFGTPLIENAACAYMTCNALGIAQCGIEQAWLAGLTDFKKPVSCHLYPIRIVENHQSGLDVLHYDRWDICSAACDLGEKERLPLFRFVKDGLIRKYGEGFYQTLEEVAADRRSSERRSE